MHREWSEAARGTSEGWVYSVEMCEVGGKFYTRILPGSHPRKILDGAYDSPQEAIAAAKEFAERVIREIRAAEGYPAA